MARCPFAVWHPISGSSGPHVGGPFKIVHHTTEGSTAEGALGAFAQNKPDPHFTVDATRIFQHIDTAEGARALRNAPGGVQTNRDSAVQIELVGFAHLPKDPRALTTGAAVPLDRGDDGVPRSGPPACRARPRTAATPAATTAMLWPGTDNSGHYGHCHVPENSHWDPGYNDEELAFIMNASFDARGALAGRRLRLFEAPGAQGPPRQGAGARATIDDARPWRRADGLVGLHPRPAAAEGAAVSGCRSTAGGAQGPGQTGGHAPPQRRRRAAGARCGG